MTDIRPIVMTWDGDAMIPLGSLRKICNEQFVVGQRYRLGLIEDRSRAQHGFFFACMTEAWQNLPEDLAAEFHSPDALRKFCLIKRGFHNCKKIVVGEGAAQEVAALVRIYDEFAIVEVSEGVVTIWTAKSQSVKAMGKDEFKTSIDAVLEEAAVMAKTSREALERNAREVA